MKLLPVLALLYLLASPLSLHAGEIVTEVHVNAPQGAKGVNATINFKLADRSRTTVLVCDMRGNVVRTLMETKELDAGEHSVTWDGLDLHNAPCGGGVYLPVIQVESASLGAETYSPTSTEWGGEVQPYELTHDKGAVSFAIDRRTYARVRIGLPNGGPLYNTLAPWQVFEAGQHSLPWDGKDATGRVDVAARKSLDIAFDGFTLPANAICVPGQARLPDAASAYNQIPLQAVRSGQPSYFALYSEPLLPEPEFEVRFKNARGPKNEPQLGKAVQFEIILKKGFPEINLSETMIFIDHTFIVEYPTTSTPASITFDASNVSPGKHLFTVNLIASDDRIGTWSIPVTFK